MKWHSVSWRSEELAQTFLTARGEAALVTPAAGGEGAAALADHSSACPAHGTHSHLTPAPRKLSPTHLPPLHPVSLRPMLLATFPIAL